MTECQLSVGSVDFLNESRVVELALLNVTRSDESAVGPRPLLVRYVGRHSPQLVRRPDVDINAISGEPTSGLVRDWSDERLRRCHLIRVDVCDRIHGQQCTAMIRNLAAAVRHVDPAQTVKGVIAR